MMNLTHDKYLVSVVICIVLLVQPFLVNAADYSCKAPNVDELIRGYQLELHGNPDIIVVMKELASCYIRKDRKKQAQELIDEILKRNPGDLDGQTLQGKLYFAKKNWEQAYEVLAHVTAVDRYNVEASKYLSSVLFHLGRTQESSVEYERYKDLINE